MTTHEFAESFVVGVGCRDKAGREPANLLGHPHARPPEFRVDELKQVRPVRIGESDPEEAVEYVQLVEACAERELPQYTQGGLMLQAGIGFEDVNGFKRRRAAVAVADRRHQALSRHVGNDLGEQTHPYPVPFREPIEARRAAVEERQSRPHLTLGELCQLFRRLALEDVQTSEEREGGVVHPRRPLQPDDLIHVRDIAPPHRPAEPGHGGVDEVPVATKEFGESLGRGLTLGPIRPVEEIGPAEVVEQSKGSLVRVQRFLVRPDDSNPIVAGTLLLFISLADPRGLGCFERGVARRSVEQHC